MTSAYFTDGFAENSNLIVSNYNPTRVYLSEHATCAANEIIIYKTKKREDEPAFNTSTGVP